MRAQDFFGKQARRDTQQTISAIESGTAAEVVVAVEPSSGGYGAADVLFGSLLALAVSLVFVFHPSPFDSALFPIELVLSFMLGVATSANVPPLRRRLTPRSALRANAERAAKAKFVDLGVSRTRDRSGMLVFVSMFEKEVLLIRDIGLVGKGLDRPLAAAQARLSAAVARLDRAAFTRALATLAAPLARAWPRRPDDVNELSDEVVGA